MVRNSSPHHYVGFHFLAGNPPLLLLLLLTSSLCVCISQLLYSTSFLSTCLHHIPLYQLLCINFSITIISILSLKLLLINLSPNLSSPLVRYIALVLSLLFSRYYGTILYIVLLLAIYSNIVPMQYTYTYYIYINIHTLLCGHAPSSICIYTYIYLFVYLFIHLFYHTYIYMNTNFE